MDDLPCPFNQKTLDFYLRLLLLLWNVMHSQSFMQHCPVRTAVGGFPNFTSEAGSPFSFKLPLPATLGHMQHYQLSLVDGDGTLPHWMVFGQQSLSLVGLALTEDCGIYHLTVSVTGEKCAAFFYLNILNKTLTDKDPARESLSCSEGEMTIWANLVLQLNPVTLDASQRLRLVSTMMDYLHLPMGFVCLLSSQQQKKLRVCRQGGLSEKPDVSDVAELLWPVGCQAEERQSDLASVLEHNVKAGGLARLLEAPVLGWRMLCAPGGLRQKVKRDLQRPKFAPAPNVKLDHSLAYSLPLKLEPSLSTISWQRNLKGVKLEPVHAEDSTDQQSPKEFTFKEHVFKTLTQRSDIDKETNHTQKVHSPLTSLPFFEQTGFHPYSEDQLVCTHLNWYSFCNSQELLKQTGLSATKIKAVVEGNSCREQVSHVSEGFWTTELFSSLFLPEHESTVRHFLGEPAIFPTLLPSPTPHSVYPSQPLTPASYSVASTLTHEAGDGESHATRLTLRPHLKETSLWTEHYRANHTDSESQPTVSSQGHVIFSQEPTEEPSLHSLQPSVSHPPLTQNFNDILLLNSRLKPPPSSNKILATQLFPDVSPTSYLTTEQLSISPQTGTIQHLSPAPSGVNQNVMSQLNATTQDESSTALTGQLTLSGQTELESSLSSFLLEPSVMTPALPSEFGLFSGQRETLNITNPEFSEEFLKASSSFISLSLLPDTGTSSLHQNLESKVALDFCFDRNEQTQTLISGVLLTSVLPVEISSSIKSPHIISVPLTMLKDQTSVKSAHESSLFIPSVQQTLVPTLHLEESHQTDNSSYLFSVPGNTTVKLGQTVTYPVLLSVSETTDPVSESHFDPTAPSTAQQPHTTSPVHLIQSLEPSFPLCGQSVAKDHVFVSGCIPPIKSTYVENTLEDVLTFLTSYSGDERHWTTTIKHTSSLAVGLSSGRRQSSVRPSSSSASVSNSLNLPPKVLQSVPVLMATVGFPFHYSVPPQTFLDPEDGEADALSLEISLIDGPPLSLGTWLTLDGLELRGVPLEVDLQFAPQRLLLVARDRRGLNASLPLTLDLQRSLVEPCHVFTLTAQRSLHSILRQRHRVELLLRKLSRFFNSSSSRHLSVVSLMPGSTVVSWYNCSLCEMGQVKRTHCHVDEIQSMWLAMRSADGSVSPEFREAMLPEYPVTKVGPVSYRQDCFSATPPSTFGSSNTTTNPGSGTNTSLGPTSNTCVSTSQQTDSYQWMAAMFTALLVVCLLILIVLLFATALYFCRGRGRSRAAIWPANRLLSVQSRDLRAIRPRRPPLLQPELPPPPLRLWINLTRDDERPLPLDCDQGQKTRPPHYDFSSK